MRYLAILFLLTPLLKSQNNSGNVFTLKPALGINGCQIHGDSYSGYNKFGLFGGIAVNAQFKNEKTSLELGFYFSQKGSRHNPSKYDASYYRLHLNYIDLPLSIRYAVNNNYFITLGFSAAYLVNYTENVNYADYTGKYIYNRYEAGLNFGLGRMIREKFFIELRCSNSITPIRRIIAPIYYPNPIARFFNKGYYSNILTLFIAYKLNFQKQNYAGEE
jgi:hypothetical protein